MLDFTSAIADDDLSPAPEPTPANDQVLLDAYSNAVIGVTERVGPAVVRVETGPKVRTARQRGGLGSGIVISPDGLVLTNSHVVGSSKEIRLRDIEGFVTDAHVLGVDPDTDLALLAQIEPDSPAAKAGLLPGDVVIKLDGVEINGVDDLIRVLDRDRIGRTLAMDVLRLGRLRAIDIHPVERKPAARQ